VSVTVSPSASACVAEAAIVSFVPTGTAGSPTVAVGAELSTVALADVSGAELAVPSVATTRTLIASPLSPLPAWERSSVELVAPAMSTPLRRHW
jgi:hypothetical protein